MPTTAPESRPPRIVQVAVGMVLDGKRVLIARRHDQAHQGGLWEFPGGKVEAGESTPEALARELAEEVGLAAEADRMTPLTCLEFDYGDKVVRLDTWLCHHFSGEAKGLEGQPIRWVTLAELDDYAFPEANQTLIERLREHLEQPSGPDA